MAWEDLQAIIKLNADQVISESSRPPIACPNDGTTLLTGPDGELYCPFDGWRGDSFNQHNFLEG